MTELLNVWLIEGVLIVFGVCLWSVVSGFIELRRERRERSCHEAEATERTER